MKSILIIATIVLFYNNHSFSQNWSTPIVIGNSNYSTRADIAVDSNNLIHVVFEVNERGDHYPDDIYYTFYNGQEWVQQKNISNTDTNSQFPDIKVDKENSLHVIWGDPKFSQTKNIWHRKYNKTWSQPTSFFYAKNDIFTIATIRYEFDSKDRLHLIWFQVPELKYRYIENEYLSDVKIIKRFAFTQDFKIHNDKIHLTFIAASTNSNESLFYQSYDLDNVMVDSSYMPDSNSVRSIEEHTIRDPQIFVGSNGRVHLIWIEGTDPRAWANEIYHCYSDDDGITWSEAVDITHNEGTSHYPGVVIDSKDNIHVVWAQSLFKSSLRTDHIGYVFFDGESWSEPEKILSPVNSWPNITIDSKDFLHITYDVKLDGLHKVVYSTTRLTTSVINREKDVLPNKFELLQNYPNPFNSSTTITFSLPSTEEVSLGVYNIKGEIVKKIINKNILTPGAYSVQWNGIDEKGNLQSSSVYFYRLETNKFVKTKKMILLL